MRSMQTISFIVMLNSTWSFLTPSQFAHHCHLSAFKDEQQSHQNDKGQLRRVDTKPLPRKSFMLYDSDSTRSSATVSNNDNNNSNNKRSLLDDSQIDFVMGYMNKHHSHVLMKFVQTFTPLGQIQMKKNAFSGGSYEILDAKVVGIDYYHSGSGGNGGGNGAMTGFLTLEATVEIRGKKEPTIEVVKVSLDAVPIKGFQRQYPNHPQIQTKQSSSTISLRPINYMNQFIRKLNRLCNIVKESTTTGKLTQLAFQKGGDKNLILKENLYLNQVPHNTFVRHYFYDMASEALLGAVIACSDGLISNRMKMTVLFPEMNPFMDSYRIGTLLEIARAMTITLAEQNLRVRVCVQGSMGVGIFTGTPKALSGASTLLQRMDWQSNEGEQNEGMVGNYVNFGAVGKEHVVNAGMDRRGNPIEQDDVFIIICPQSMVGVDSSIIGPLSEMVDAAGDRPVILLNPDLVDKVSSQGQQNIRGRKERIEFAESFQTIFHFQNIYVSGTSYFPILGAVTKTSYDEPWIAYQRRDRVDDGGEIYIPVLSAEDQPDGENILKSFE